MPPYAAMVTGYYCTAHSGMGGTIDSGYGGSSGYGSYSGIDLPTVYSNVNMGQVAENLLKVRVIHSNLLLLLLVEVMQLKIQMIQLITHIQLEVHS